MQLARKGPAGGVREVLSCIPEYPRFLRTYTIYPSLLHPPPPTLDTARSSLFFYLSSCSRPGETSFLVALAKSPSSRRRRRRFCYAKDIRARGIPPRVIARYEFHVVLARKTTFARDARRGNGSEDEDVLQDEVKKPEGRLIRFYSLAAGRERGRERESSPLIKKRHLRTAIAGEERRGPTVAR